MKPRFPLIVLSGIFTATSAIAVPIICSETCSSKNHNIPNCAKASCIFCRDVPTEKTKEIWSCDTCNNGYKTGIDQTIQNDWLRDAYKCVLDCKGKCGTPPSPSTGTVSDSTKLYKHTTTYYCDENPDTQACDWVVDIVYSCNNSAYQSNNTVSCNKKQTVSIYSCSGCTKCPSNATCNGSTTFKCDDGFYKSGSGCASCPSNATCTNGTDFTCDDKYCKSGNKCEKLPDNAQCDDGVIKCNKDYYKSGDSCKACGSIIIGNKEIDATSDVGATSKSDCQFPADEINFNEEQKDIPINGHTATIKIKSCY